MLSILEGVRADRSARSVECWLTVAAIVFATCAGVEDVRAQSCPTNSPLALYSPTTLSIDFEQSGTLGNRLQWPAVESELGTCSSLLISPEFESRLGVRLEGNFLDVYDRRIGVEFTEGGVVGATDVSDVRVTVENSHPNTNAQNLIVGLNLSARGGIFRWNPGTNRAPQVNEGVPTYLSSTSVRSLAMSADGSRVYAGVTQVPILRSDNGGPWVETTVGPPPFSVEPEAIVVSPNNPDRLWVRSNREGLWRSDDAGETWSLEIGISRDENVDYGYFDLIEVIPPGGTTPQPVMFIFASGLGLYYSVDDGNTWMIAEGLEVPQVTSESGFEIIDCNNLVPVTDFEVFDIEVSRVDAGHIFIALSDWGVYEVDVQGGFQDWIPRFNNQGGELGGLVLCRGDDNLNAPLGRKRTVTEIAVLEPVGGQDQIVALSDIPPIVVEPNPNLPPLPVTLAFSSNDGGRTWNERASGYPNNGVSSPIRANTSFVHPDPSESRTVVAGIRGQGLWQLTVPTDDTVAAWEPVTYEAGAEVLNPSVRSALPLPSGEVLIGTINAGSYRLGEIIELDRAIELNTEAGVEPITTGIQLSFDNPGTINSGERFEIIAQAFQGYAVWRSSERDLVTEEPQWELIGLMDLANPETCSPSACDAVALETTPGCFAEKRANCFTYNASGNTWEFFDRDVGAGFSYDYAVTSFDYGFTGDETPDGSQRDFLFSPRSELESAEQSPQVFRDLRGGENYNQVFFQVNTVPSNDLDEVWAVPNPFVRRAGWDDSADNFIRFFNVTDTASVEIFTIAGDFVRRLENVVFNDRETGLIEWDTRNAEGEQVASGVYIFRVTDDAGGEEIGRLTLIR